MSDPLGDLLTHAMRRDSIALGYRDTRNGRDVVKLRASRHSFPEDVLNEIQSSEYRVESVTAMMRDHLHEEVVLVDTPDMFEPIPVIVVGKDR